MNPEINQSPSAKPTVKWMLGSASRTIAFGFGSGLSPTAPGTAGTLWAWASFLIGSYFLTTANWLWIIGAGILLGCWICGHVSEELGKKDFGGIVWDEIVAFWLILALTMPMTIWMQALAFGVFRFFDAAKPGPIGLIDHHFKHLEENNNQAHSNIKQTLWRGFGIIADDLAAAFLTYLVIVAVQVAIQLSI
jgi:phosphatidylglycerophosphatase A